MEGPRELAHQVAKVHAVVGGKVAHAALAAKEILHAHRLHGQAFLLGQGAKDGQRLVAFGGQLGGAVVVLFGGHADDRGKLGLADGLIQLLLGDLEGIGDGKTHLGAATGLADHVVAGSSAGVAGIKPQIMLHKGESHR